MKVIGLIAEFNPFHNGHKRIINLAKTKYNADYLVVVQSGDFVQRGSIAILDKYTRASMAIEAGADLVIELPVIYSTSSSEYFATGSILTLESLGVIDSIIFGSEVDSSVIYNDISNIITENAKSINYYTKLYLKQGHSYPKAYKDSLSLFLDDEHTKILNNPNFMLGLSYANAINKLNSDIKIINVKRNDSGYNSINCFDKYSSALAIRKNIAKGSSKWKQSVPLSKFYNCNFMFDSDLAAIIYEKIMCYNIKQLSNIYGINNMLANRLKNNINLLDNLEEFIKKIVTKNTTYSSISRALIHLLLNINEKDALKLLSCNKSYYLRLLAINSNSLELLRVIKKRSKSSLVGVLSEYTCKNKIANQMLGIDIQSSNLYQGLKALKYNTKIINEHSRNFNIIK